MQVSHRVLSEVSVSDIQRRCGRIHKAASLSIVSTERYGRSLGIECANRPCTCGNVDIAPKYAVSDIMGYLKGKLAMRLFQRYEKLGKRYWGRHLWSRGYCVSTVGLDEEQIRKYVKWQEKREKDIEATQGKLFD